MSMPLGRTPQLVAGLVIFGAGIGLIVQGDNGQDPWTVLHDGISERSPLSIGGATVITGAVVLVAIIVMRIKIGLGTILNVMLIGPATDLTIWLVDQPDSSSARALLTLAGPIVTAIGSSLYLGVRLGPGPRDGLMQGLNARGASIRIARFAIEASAFVAGLLLGGSAGWGTLWWLLTIGPAVQWTLPWFDRGSPVAT